MASKGALGRDQLNVGRIWANHMQGKWQKMQWMQDRGFMSELKEQIEGRFWQLRRV